MWLQDPVLGQTIDQWPWRVQKSHGYTHFYELKSEITGIPLILSDSTSAAAIAANPVYYSKTKHIEIDLQFLRDKVERNEVEIIYIPSNDQVADALTNLSLTLNSAILGTKSSTESSEFEKGCRNK